MKIFRILNKNIRKKIKIIKYQVIKENHKIKITTKLKVIILKWNMMKIIFKTIYQQMMMMKIKKMKKKKELFQIIMKIMMMNSKFNNKK